MTYRNESPFCLISNVKTRGLESLVLSLIPTGSVSSLWLTVEKTSQDVHNMFSINYFESVQ